VNSETSSTMELQSDYGQTTTAKLGWGILLIASMVLILGGLSWFGMLPQMMLENITEYTNLEPGVFMQGQPSAFDVITIVARGYGAGYAALGVMALLLALEGYRNGTRWAWMVLWVLVAVYIAIGGIFFMAGESQTLSLPILFIAVLAAVGLLLTRKSVS
jgi:hypothetical protein